MSGAMNSSFTASYILHCIGLILSLSKKMKMLPFYLWVYCIYTEGEADHRIMKQEFR